MIVQVCSMALSQASHAVLPPLFQMLQRFQKQPTAPTLYFVFDVLWSNGTHITGKTLMERRAVLETIISVIQGADSARKD
jgi:ATP-dependent DNA ligase